MFVFLLILAELAILYTVFWYLYLRAPKHARRIVSGTWGSYNQADTSGGSDAQMSAVKSFMVPAKEEMILDLRTNHYVPLPQKKASRLVSIIQQLDNCLSELNVKA